MWKNAFQKSKFGSSVFVRPDLTSGVVSLEHGSIKENALLNMHCFVLRLKINKNESGELLKMYSPLIERAGANVRHAEESTSNLSL